MTIPIISYCRVSTEDQAQSGLGLEDQARVNAAYITSQEPRGWGLLRHERDEGVSTRLPPSRRPAMVRTMAAITSGEAAGFVVSKLDRMSRNRREIEDLFLAAQHPKKGFILVSLDIPGLDTSTSVGKVVLAVMAAFAEFERDRVSERTRAALQAKRARGEVLGATRKISAEVERYIRELRNGTGGQPLSYRDIARQLTREGIPTVSGSTWASSTVATVINRS